MRPCYGDSLPCTSCILDGHILHEGGLRFIEGGTDGCSWIDDVRVDMIPWRSEEEHPASSASGTRDRL